MNLRKLPLQVVLIGSENDKAAFIRACGVENPHPRMENDRLYHPNELQKHQYEYEIIEHKSISFVIWDIFSINCFRNRSPVRMDDVDAFIYLNRASDKRKEYENISKPHTYVSYDYQSTDFKHALNCLENIASPQGSYDKDYDKKLSFLLSAHAFDEFSILAYMKIPKEVNVMICKMYSLACNRDIFLFKPEIMGTPTAMLTHARKVEREERREAESERSRLEWDSMTEEERSEKMKKICQKSGIKVVELNSNQSSDKNNCRIQ